VSIRILLVNHHPLIRSTLRLLLEREPDFRVVGEAANGKEAVVLAEYKHPEIILLDVKLPVLNGILAAKEISSKDGASRTAFVATHTEEGYVAAAFKAGAKGYVAGDTAPTDLAHAIRVIANGGLFLSPAISAALLSRPPDNRQLLEYEKQLCCLMAAGYDAQEIASRLQQDLNQVKLDCRRVSHALGQYDAPDVVVQSVVGNQPLTDP
jgi:DNA-binding NarL/FixJ family response regulator